VHDSLLGGILRRDALFPTNFDCAMTTGESQQALVTATFSQRMRLRLDNGSEVTGRLKGKKIRPVCGDLVEARVITNEPEWLITNIVPRKNELSRPDKRGRIEVLAANIDLVAVVTADAPTVDWYIVDRYLAAAELINVSALVVFNKTDLAAASETTAIELADLGKIGYAIIKCSAETGDNLQQLQQHLSDRTAIIVGQSGVGKSSLINYLVKDAEQQTATVSQSTGEGRHTTVNSVMWSLPDGGAVIDSPGVRDYAPAIDSPDLVARGFREIDECSQSCRFANCRHLREPHCAVKSAVDTGDISARRYESYRRLLSYSQKLADSFQG
jgi:ribosome biogenesis GTPase